jgi:redox-sensitive bicupin YhaK (pirin superfamily)
MMEPRYRDVKAEAVPELVQENGTKIRVICGQVGDIQGPVRDIVTDPEYLDVSVPPESQFVHPTRRGHTLFAYIIQGSAHFGQEKDPFSYEVEGTSYFDMQRSLFLGNASLVLFDDGDQIIVTTEDAPVRFLLISGQPITEPVAWYGPIVMNTRDELRIAFEELQNGTFIKHK